MNNNEEHYTNLSVFLIVLIFLTAGYLLFFYDNSNISLKILHNENIEELKPVISKKDDISEEKNNSKVNEKDYIIEEKHNMKINEEYLLKSNTDKKLKYISEDDNIATVDENGKVISKNSGTVNIIAIDEQGKSDKIEIIISDDTKKSFNITKNEIVLSKSVNYSVEYKVNPSNEVINWSSSNSNIANVSSNGMVTTKEKGTAIITGITNSGLKDTIVINVVEEQSYFNINKTELSIDEDQKYKLTINKNIAGTIVWKSSNTNIATVDNSGTVTAKAPGKATITASLGDYKATCTLTVIKVTKHVQKVTLNKTNVSLKVGETTSVIATISPSNADNKSLTWKTANSAIAVVNSNGVITARSVGSTKITVTSVDNSKTATVNVTVNPIIPTKLTLQASKTELNVGESITLTSTVTPSNATDKRIEYSSSNSSVASVSSTGKITALKAGTAKITGKTILGGITSSVTIKVINKKTYTINFYPNGSTGSTVTKTCTTTSTSCSVTTPAISRSGFNISGWSTEKNASSASVKANATISVSSSASYYAITSKTVAATFNKNTITNDISIGSTSNSCTIRNDTNTCTVKLPTITRSGFTILGWSTSSTAASGTAPGNSVALTNNATYYAITKINTDGNIIGATGYSALNSKQYLYETASTSSKKLLTLPWGQPFTILSEDSTFWYISYKGTKGYVIKKYCMINLPDYIPSMTYDIKDAYNSIMKSSGYNVPDITGKKIYNYGKTYNNRLKREEFIAPLTYETAKKLLAAQKTALNNGYSLKLYDSYRPRSISTLLSQKLTALYNSNATVRANIDYSTTKSGNKYYWGQGWFSASGLSTHNVGAAVDISMTNKGSTTDLPMPSAMNEVSTQAIKYYSPNVSHIPDNYSKGMWSSQAARNMHTYMINAGFADLASEWWHFQNNDDYNLIKKSEPNGCDFTPQGIASQ